MTTSTRWFFIFCITNVLQLVLLPQNKSFGQAPAIEWEKSYGGSNEDAGHKIIRTTDGGYVFVGWSYSTDGDIVGQHPGGVTDIVIIKIDPVGNISWKKIIGGSNWDDALDIKQTPDGGYIVCGHNFSDDGDFANKFNGLCDAYALKLDALGNIQWLRNYGGVEYDVFLSIDNTPDGGYIATGYTGSNNEDVSGLHGDYDVWVVKLDAAGNIQWQKCVGGTDRDAGWSIKTTPEGDYIFTGWSRATDGDISNPKGLMDLIVGKLDDQGNLLWLKDIGGSQEDWGWDIICTKDGGYAVAGYSASSDGDLNNNYGLNDAWVLKLDIQGNIQWQKKFGGNDYDDAYSIEQTSDGGFIVLGRTRSSNFDVSLNHGDNDYWLFKIDVNGVLQWEKTLGGSKQDLGYSVTSTTDGGYIVVGNANSDDGDATINKGKADIWVVKLGDCTLSTPAVPTSINGSDTPCAGTTVTYNVAAIAGATGYTWSVPAGWSLVSGQGTTQITVTVGNDPGNLNVLAYNSCKFSGKQILTGTPVIIVAPQITIQPNVAGSICKGTPVAFTAQTVNAVTPSYQWKKNGNNVGGDTSLYNDNNLQNNDIITCEMTSVSACGSPFVVLSRATTMVVNEPVTPTIGIVATQTDVCAGTQISFTATTTNQGAQPQFTWYINNVAVGNNTSFNSSTLSNGDQITCVLNSNESCVTNSVASSDPITVSIRTDTLASILIKTAATTICKNDEVTFQATISDAGTTPVYTWKVNGIKAGLNSSTFKTTSLSNTDQVTCVVTPGQNTCATQPAASNVINIMIHPLPIITLYPTDTIVTPGAQVTFKTLVSEDIRSFNWTPASLLVNPLLITPTSIAIEEETTFSLNIVTLDGCLASKDAVIKPLYPLYIPNAFTPNGDDKNDLFRIPPYVDFNLTELRVFNRWGEMVFSTKDIRMGWDGRFKGQPQPTGVYVYQIYGLVKEKKVLLKGYVTLIR